MIFAALLAAVGSAAGATSSLGAESSLEVWMNQQRVRSELRLFQGISPSGGAAGSVMASPSKADPDYFYHWIRDAALTMREAFELRGNYPTQSTSVLKDYTLFSRGNQTTKNPSGDEWSGGLGEPKFNMDGSAYWQPWGRPQNDGPALRALVLIDFATDLIKKGQLSWVNRYLYRAELPATTVIKTDLEYTSHHWADPSFDLWEESEGDHFYTRITQWRALDLGSRFARTLGDGGAADFYALEAAKILKSLDGFWVQSEKRLVVSTRMTGGIDWKKSKIDVAVILGVLHANSPAGQPLAVDDERVMNTALLIESTFENLYKVNAVKETPDHLVLGAAIGRYPEDRYDGVGMSLGNPWFLATHAFAEYYYKLSKTFRTRTSLKLSPWMKPWLEGIVGYSTAAQILERARLSPQSDAGGGAILLDRQALNAITIHMIEKADSFVRRSKFHADQDGHLSEQIERDSGYLRGAKDLTWNYASFLSLLRNRN